MAAKMSVIALSKELNVARAKTALKFYHEEHRATYEAENEGQSAREIRAALKEMFEGLDTEERAVYLAKEKEDRTRFMDELRREMQKAGMDLSLLPSPTEKKAKKPKRVTLAKALGITPCKSAFIHFGMHFRTELAKNGEEMAATAVMRAISDKWNTMTDKQKTKFTKIAAKDKKRYLKEIEAAKKAHPEIVEENEKTNAAVRKQRRKTRKNDPSRIKRAKTAYMCFCDANRQRVKEENPEMPAKDVLRTLATMWKETDNNSRKPYQALAKKDKERYEKERQERQERKMKEDEEAATGNDDDEDNDGNDDEHLDKYEQVRAAIEEEDDGDEE
jgi:hypothetical protein